MTRLNFITIVKFNEFTIYVCAPHKVWVNRITQNIYRGRGKCCDGTDALSGNRMRKALWFIILNESECVWGEWKTEEKRPPHSSGDCVILNRAKKKFNADYYDERRQLILVEAAAEQQRRKRKIIELIIDFYCSHSGKILLFLYYEKKKASERRRIASEY